MFTVEEVCEEQERQYNRLMQEDDQYCHPESFKWGFEHGLEYALTKAGWHPASELPPENTEIVIWTEVHSPQFENAPVGYVPILGRLIDGKWPSNIIVKYWCYPPKNE